MNELKHYTSTTHIVYDTKVYNSRGGKRKRYSIVKIVYQRTGREHEVKNQARVKENRLQPPHAIHPIVQ